MQRMSPHLFCNGETEDMYEFDEWDWRCKLCNKFATEDHCQTPKHKRWVLFQSSTDMPMTSSDRRPGPYRASGAPQTHALPAQLTLSQPWSVHFDDRHQKHYYYNQQTLVSHWHNPISEILWRKDAQAWGISADALVSELHCGPVFVGLSMSWINHESDRITCWP